MELVSFGISAKVAAKWIPTLWKKLGRIRKTREKELNEINDIIFGDPLGIARYYVEPKCQEMNPADRRIEDFLVAKEPVMTKIDDTCRAGARHRQGCPECRTSRVNH